MGLSLLEIVITMGERYVDLMARRADFTAGCRRIFIERTEGQWRSPDGRPIGCDFSLNVTKGANLRSKVDHELLEQLNGRV